MSQTAILDGAAQIVTPAFVSLLCICIVFVPMFFLEGVARFLFVPMAMAVMYAMVCSFILSRTLVPTMAMYLLRPHSHEETTAPSSNPLVGFQRNFAEKFERFRGGYKQLLVLAMSHRRRFVTGFMLFVLVSFALVPFLGRNFFPSVDSGQIMIHFRAQPGTRRCTNHGHIAEVPPANLGCQLVGGVGNQTRLVGRAINRHPLACALREDRGERDLIRLPRHEFPFLVRPPPSSHGAPLPPINRIKIQFSFRG